MLAASLVALGVFGGVSSVERDVFQFSRGLLLANGEADRLRVFLARALPDERVHVTILGHTGSSGDASANMALSEERAAFARAVAAEMGIPSGRVTARGVGGGAPLPKEERESERVYQARLARVEVSLQMRR